MTQATVRDEGRDSLSPSEGNAMRREFAIPDERPVVIMTEDLAFPVDRAWVARYEPLYLGQWWKPEGYTNPIVELDLEVGGQWRIVQRDPQGNSFSFYGAFEVVEPMSRTVQTLTSELFPDRQTRITTEFVETARGTLILTEHDLGDMPTRAGFLGLGALERMAETSENYEALLRQLSQR